MKKLLLSVSLLACLAAFNACTTDVELYADYKDIPVIYGVLDASFDTNYIRINRAFSGSNDHPINANEVAMIADSCNYPGKLKAYIVEYQRGYGNQYSPTGEVVELDTMTIHDKEDGIFYSPDQKIYFGNTSRVFANNSPTHKYLYKLFVHKDNDTITCETNLVGGENFKIITQSLNFDPEPSNRSSQVKFTHADNAVFYDVRFEFCYYESHNGGPYVSKKVSYNSGPRSLDELGIDGTIYYISYPDNLLFSLLADAIGADTVVDANHPNVERYFDERPMNIYLSAGGDELYNYIKVNSVSGFSQTIPDYTNVTGGYGVFSSKINLSLIAGLSSKAQTGLYGKFKSWGFVQH